MGRRSIYCKHKESWTRRSGRCNQGQCHADELYRTDVPALCVGDHSGEEANAQLDWFRYPKNIQSRSSSKRQYSDNYCIDSIYARNALRALSDYRDNYVEIFSHHHAARISREIYLLVHGTCDGQTFTPGHERLNLMSLSKQNNNLEPDDFIRIGVNGIVEGERHIPLQYKTPMRTNNFEEAFVKAQRYNLTDYLDWSLKSILWSSLREQDISSL